MMAQRNKPAQRVNNKRNFDLTNDLDDWLEPHSTDDNDVVVCSSVNRGKISSSAQLDVLQDDHCSPSSKSRYNPLPFINDDRRPTASCSDRTSSSVAVVVDCKQDELFIAYGGQPTTTTTNSSTQYVVNVSSSLPAVHHRHSDGSCDPVHHISDRQCDPITVLSDEEMDVHSSSDHVMSGENSSDHVMSGDSGDRTTQRLKRKRRKLISSNKDLVAHWQPKPISVEGDLAVVTKSSTLSNTDDSSAITVEEHNSTSSHDHTTPKGQGSSNTRNTCDLTTVEGRGSSTACDLTTVEGCGSATALDLHNNNKRRVTRNDVTNNKKTESLWSNRNTYTRPSLTSVKSAKLFYSQSSGRHKYDFAPFPNKSKPNAIPLFPVQSKLKGYKIPHKSQQGTGVANDDDSTKKKPSLVEALSVIDQSSNASNTGRSSNTGNTSSTGNTGSTRNTGRSSGTSTSKYFGQVGTSLERPRLAKHHVSNETGMLNSVHLDCSQARVGTLHGIAEGASLSMESLTFELDDGQHPHLIVITPLIDAVRCCKINLQRQPYVMQLLLFSGPAKTVNSKAKISGRVYDPESSYNHLKFIQLIFDLKPSSEACEAINKILERLNKCSTIGWFIERDTISSDDIYNAPPTTTTSVGSTSSNRRSAYKSYATRSKSSTTSPLQAIKDNYTISDDDDDDDDFEFTTNTTTTATRRSTRLSSVTKVKPADDKLLLSYRPGTLARAVSIFLSDLDCLHEGEFLNDKIIDFYLKYLWYDKLLDDSNRNRVHVFSPFFHTRLVNSSFAGGKKGSQYDPELLHSRVKNWTKNVDLFTKELVILPVCQSSHWYVAVICHAGLFEATSNRSTLTLNDSSTDIISGILDDPPLAVTSPQSDFHSNSSVINKSLRPCILILDSLGGRPRTPTIGKIRKYLTAEWKHKHNDKEEKDFSTFIVLSQNKLKVPLQENSSDCGLFVLQYVETLLQRVILDNQPIPQTEEEWFTFTDISKKRNNLHELITTLSTLSDVT